MVKCNGCRYLRGYTEYGYDYIYCKHNENDKIPESLDLDNLINDTELEHNCGNWCSCLVKEPHELYMNLFNLMLKNLNIG